MNVKTLRSFLGFTGYYRRFVKDYARIVKPLNDLLIGHSTHSTINTDSKKKKKKKVSIPWQWGETEQHAFDTVKEKLLSPPILAYSDFTKPFILHTDASTDGLGAVLYQEQDGLERVVAYASRGLKPSEKNYPAHKLEFLCLKWAVTEKFHDYLYGNNFVVYTDNNPLTYVLSSAKLDATGHRWLASLGCYNFNLVYRSGKANGDADGLSRRPQEDIELCSDAVQAICSAYTIERDSCPYVENLVVNCNSHVASSRECFSPDDSSEFRKVDWPKEQLADPDLARVIYWFKRGYYPDKFELQNESPVVLKILREWKRLDLVNNVLYRHTVLDGEDVRQLVLPSHFRSEVLKQLHDDVGHQGRDRTLSLVRQRFYWPGLESDVEEKVKNCIRCIKRKTVPKPSAELVNIVSSQPMELVCIDFLSLERSKGGFENILVITDHFTRYAQAFPTRNQLAKTTAKILFENFIVHYGFPARIHSDQGRNFESGVIKELCSLAGVAKSRTTPYHPMGNGMVERFNQTLLKMLGTLEENQKEDWKSYVAPLVHSYNATRHDSTGYSPFFLMFGRHPRLAVDAYFGIRKPDEPISSKEHYATKLKKRLRYAYKVAASEAEKNAHRHKAQYDAKVREATLDIGDRVLIRNVGLKGKHKLADKWDKYTYIVIDMPDKNIPVYKVQKESGDASVKILHRNMMLPFSAIPCISEVEKPAEVKRTIRTRNSKSVTEKTSVSDSSSDSSSEDSDFVLPVPRYVAPHRRHRNNTLEQKIHNNNNRSSGSVADKSHVRFSVSSDIGNGLTATEPTSGASWRDTSAPIVDVSHSDRSQSCNQPSISVGNDNNHSNSFLPQEPSIQPRRSNRVRQAPNRYGDWHMNQQTVADQSASQIWYV